MTTVKLIETEDKLDEMLTTPPNDLIQFIRSVSSPLLVLGAGGKMGPTLAVLARRAAEAAGHSLEVVAVSRFANSQARDWLEMRGVKTIRADLLQHHSVEALPDSKNVIYLVGLKFGTTDTPYLTWASNTLVPSAVAQRYAASRLVALSTGNVYPLSPTDGPGLAETAQLTPVGEYANSCVARERIFEYFSRTNKTPVALIRLSYAVDLRYGVLVDIAQKVLAEAPVDVSMGYLNCIWQGDANAMIIRALGLTANPPFALNLTGTHKVSVRDVAQRFGKIMGREPRIVGTEAETALLSDTSRLQQTLGAPVTSLDSMTEWTAHWIMTHGRTLNKPTHFEVRDGAF